MSAPTDGWWRAVSKTPDENEYFFQGAFWRPRERWKQRLPGSRGLPRRGRRVVGWLLAVAALTLLIAAVLAI